MFVSKDKEEVLSMPLTIRELVKKLKEIEDQDLKVELTTGHENFGRFYGFLEKISINEGPEGKKIVLMGSLEETRRMC